MCWWVSSVAMKSTAITWMCQATLTEGADTWREAPEILLGLQTHSEATQCRPTPAEHHRPQKPWSSQSEQQKCPLKQLDSLLSYSKLALGKILAVDAPGTVSSTYYHVLFTIFFFTGFQRGGNIWWSSSHTGEHQKSWRSSENLLSTGVSDVLGGTENILVQQVPHSCLHLW